MTTKISSTTCKYWALSATAVAFASTRDQPLSSYDDSTVAPPKPTQAAVDPVAVAPAVVTSQPDQVNADMNEMDDDIDVQITGDDSNSYNNATAANGEVTETPQYNYNHDDQPIGIKEDG